MIPKAFVDFFIIFSDSDLKNTVLRTDGVLNLVGEEKQSWKMYIQPSAVDSGLNLFHSVSKKNYRLWCFGELFQYKGKSRDTDKILDEFINDLAEDRQRPQELNGHFLMVGRDDMRRLFFIWTNRLGTYHAYYSINAKAKAIGSFFPVVADIGSEKDLDWLGITGFFGFGFFPEDRTYFKDIKIFYPASAYIFNENGQLIKHQRYWQWDYLPDRGRSYIDTVSEFGQRLEDILDDHTKYGRVALPISGGLDSRTLAALLPENRPIWSFSYGWGENSQEIKIAEKVASIRNFAFEPFIIEPYLFKNLDLITKSVECFQDIVICRQAAVVDKVYSYADYIFAAHWGDVWCDEMGTVGRQLDQEQVVKHILKKMRNHSHDWLLENICKVRLKEDFEAILHNLIKEQVNYYQNIDDIDFRIKAFKTDKWSFRWTMASIRMYQPASFPRLPFYDNRMVDFFLSVPSEFVKGRKLQIDYLRYFKPEFAKVKWQPYDANLFLYKYTNSLLLPQKILKKIFRLLNRKKTIERNWQRQFLYNDQARVNLERCLLDRDLKIHQFVSPDKIRPLIEDLFSTYCSKDTGYAVSMLLTFSEWLKRYG